jgi:hypothetical protein
MSAPLSRISLLLAILLFVAALFQKQIANALGNPLTEPTQFEQVIDGVKGAMGSQSLVELPTHPVPKTIFWLAVVIASLALWAWIVETSFWIPLVAMVIAIAAALLKMALLPVVLAAVRAGTTQAKRRSTSSSSRKRTTSAAARKRRSSSRDAD